jgi:hypothetical protein
VILVSRSSKYEGLLKGAIHMQTGKPYLNFVASLNCYANRAFTITAILVLLFTPVLGNAQPPEISEGPVYIIDNDNTGNTALTLNVQQTIDDAEKEINLPDRNSCATLVGSLNKLTDHVQAYGVMGQTRHSNTATEPNQEYYALAGYAMLDADFEGRLGALNNLIGVLGQAVLSDFFSLAGSSEHFVEVGAVNWLAGGHFRSLADNKNGATGPLIDLAEGVSAQVVIDNNVTEPFDLGGRVTNAVGGNFQVRIDRVRGKDLPPTAEIQNAIGTITAVQAHAVQPGYAAGRIQNAYGLISYISDEQGAIDPSGDRVALWTFGGENRLEDDTTVGGKLDVTEGPVINQGTAWHVGQGDPNASVTPTVGALFSQTDAPVESSPLWVGTASGWRRIALE